MGNRKRWSDQDVSDLLLKIGNDIGRMPSHGYLQSVGNAALSNQICRRGGYVFWAEKLGLKRTESDSDFGWEGEHSVVSILIKNGFSPERQGPVKYPFDILVNGILKMDVKTARNARYHRVSGWFYRIGKVPQADIIAFHQIDTLDTYFVPWHQCAFTNVTLSVGGGQYAIYRNNFTLLRNMCQVRIKELEEIEAMSSQP